jgi:D-serine deaminase-like pyridoxal phosphate-dependent protein
MATVTGTANDELVGRPGSRHLIGTPALVVDLDVLEANIASMAAHARANGYALRPVAKIHKSVEIARRQIDAGAIGVGCATLAEAEAMVDGGIPGVLLFTSVVTAPKLDRLAALNARATGLVVAADTEVNVDQLGDAARRSGRALRVLVDHEVGGRRTRNADGARAGALAPRISSTQGLAYAGVQGYNGMFQTNPDYAARRVDGLATLDRLDELVGQLRAAGLPPEIVSGGGTGSHDIDAERGVLTEIQAGTYVFGDAHYHDAALRRDEPSPFGQALTVRTTVISDAQPGFVITDAGAKEVDERHGIAPVIVRGAPPGAIYTNVGDDMGRIDFAAPGDSLAVGDVVELMPPHAYQTVIMYQQYNVVRGDELVDIWPVDAFKND